MSVDVLKPAPDSGELSKQSMDESLIPVASPVSIDDLPLLTLMSQNLRGLGHGSPYAKYKWLYLIKRGGKGLQKPAYDTAILVCKDGPFCGTKLHEFTSSTSQTVVAIRSLSLVIVNIHGPAEDKEDRATFYEALHLLLVCYKAKDWTVVIGGDFNTAPHKVDRPDGKETQHSRDFVHALCSALDLVDIAACNEHMDSALNWHLIFSYARDANVERLPKTVADKDRGVNFAISHGYVSHLDLFLVPADLAKREGIVYANRRTDLSNSYFDHDEIFATFPDPATWASRGASAGQAKPAASEAFSG